MRATRCSVRDGIRGTGLRPAILCYSYLSAFLSLMASHVENGPSGEGKFIFCRTLVCRWVSCNSRKMSRTQGQRRIYAFARHCVRDEKGPTIKSAFIQILKTATITKSNECGADLRKRWKDWGLRINRNEAINK